MANKNFLNNKIIIFNISILAVLLAPFLTIAIDTNESAFISIWKTDNPGMSEDNQITLPLSYFGVFDFIVDWGDGTQNHITSPDQPEKTHTYFLQGIYEISITGIIQGWSFNDYGDKEKIIEIKRWGDLKLGVDGLYGGYFYGARNLVITATDILDTAGIENMYNAFRNCSSLTAVPSMNDWDMSSVTNTPHMFDGAIAFNQPIGNWDVSNVDNMYGMFRYAASFNQPIDNWDVSNVTEMTEMFLRASSFNQPIGKWDVGKVANMSHMFNGASSFNQPIGNWDVSNVDNMYGMFRYAASFNQPIGNWDVSRVDNMAGMFDGAVAFNQPIGNWDVSNVTNMRNMFAGQPGISEVWGYIPGRPSSFNQDISKWNVGNVADMSSMFANSSLSTKNYNKLLIGWNNLPFLQNNIRFSSGNTQYSGVAASNARENIINQYSWDIIDGGEEKALLESFLKPDALFWNAIFVWLISILLIAAVIAFALSVYFFIISVKHKEKTKKAKLFLLCFVILILVCLLMLVSMIMFFNFNNTM